MVTLNKNTSSAVGGKIVATIFFLVFLLAGLAFTTFIGQLIYENLITYTWESASCEVLSSAVKDEANREYSVSVSYRYDFSGQSYTGSQFQRNAPTDANISNVQEYVDGLEPGTAVPCYINPLNPSEAVLRRSSVLTAFVILFPLIFVTVGAGGIYFTWKGKKSSTAITLRGRRNTATGNGIAYFLFGACALAGGLVGYFFGVVPLQKYYDSKNWNERSCTVISSEVRSHESDDDTTYSVDILYSYEFNGKSYRGNSYDFSTGSTSGYESKNKIVREHPSGKEVPCYINPHKPNESVLVRDIGNSLITALLAGAFFGVGAIGLFYTTRSGRKARSAKSSLRYDPRSATFTPSERTKQFRGDLGIPEVESMGPTVLKPSTTPLMRLFGITFAAIFWNGIVAVFLWQAYTSWNSGTVEWGMLLFLTPFVLIGLGLIVAIGYSFLALFNPRIVITMGSPAVQLGQSTSLRWNISGNTHRIKKLRFWLEAREEATYRRGTDTRTDKRKFKEIEIYSSQMQGIFPSGEATIRVPSDTMHSWSGANNKIIWSIHLRGEIDKWPDLSEEFAFFVLPHRSSGGLN